MVLHVRHAFRSFVCYTLQNNNTKFRHSSKTFILYFYFKNNSTRMIRSNREMIMAIQSSIQMMFSSMLPLEMTALLIIAQEIIFFLDKRGRACELLSYWQYLGVDQALLGEKYMSVLKQMEEGRQNNKKRLISHSLYVEPFNDG